MQKNNRIPTVWNKLLIILWIATKVQEEITAYHVDCLKDLCYAFGSDIVNEKGILNRTLLAQRAFADKEQTQNLNHHLPVNMVKEIMRSFSSMARSKYWCAGRTHFD